MEFSSGPPEEIVPWTEEDKARLNLALFGKADKPLAWIRADGHLLNFCPEGNIHEGKVVYPLYAHPMTLQGYKWLKDSTFDERSFKEDLTHENGNYHCSCCNCGRNFQGHKRKVVCKVCSTKPTETNETSGTS